MVISINEWPIILQFEVPGNAQTTPSNPNVAYSGAGLEATRTIRQRFGWKLRRVSSKTAGFLVQTSTEKRPFQQKSVKIKLY